MATITADLTAGALVEIRSEDHVWKADEPTSLGGTDLGPNPYEMLLGSLAACTCITVSFYCQRKDWKLHSISVKYHYDKIHADDCEHCDEELTGMLDHVTSEIFIEGDFDDTQRERLAGIAVRCPVHKTLANGLTFTENVTVG